MRQSHNPNEWKIQPLASAPITAFNADPDLKISLGCPSIEILPGGRMVVALDQFGPDVKKLPGKKARHPGTGHWMQGRILTSNDSGSTWTKAQPFPFRHAKLFRDGHILYLIGENTDVQLMKSVDGGLTWADPARLTSHHESIGGYAEAPANVHIDDKQICLVMMKKTDPNMRGDCGSTLAPVFMRTQQGTSLTNSGKWAFAQPIQAFNQMVDENILDYFGIPFFPTAQAVKGKQPKHIGWHDAHVFRINNPDHCWHNPDQKTYHIIFRASTHHSSFAALAKVVENEDGNLELGLEKTPAGTKFLFIPLPGGNARFQIIYDDQTRLFWLISGQSRDTMTNSQQKQPIQNNSRWQLQFSSNLIDWSFAGKIYSASSPNEYLNDISAAIHGSDIFITACSGAPDSKGGGSRQQVNVYTIPDFRSLVYE